MASPEITLEAVPSVGDVPAEDWDACANPKAYHLRGLDALVAPGSAGDFSGDSGPYYNPFVSHAFFSALEASSSACARAGWGPRHLVAKVDGRIAGIVPCYLDRKSPR